MKDFLTTDYGYIFIFDDLVYLKDLLNVLEPNAIQNLNEVVNCVNNFINRCSSNFINIYHLEYYQKEVQKEVYSS